MTKATKHANYWPTDFGDYRIVWPDGYSTWILKRHYGDETEAVAERVRAAFNDELPTLPPLPDGRPVPDGERYWTATGAWLRANDPDGKWWERSLTGREWYGDGRNAWPDFIYVIRPIPQPVKPETETVPWYQAIGRHLPDGRRITGAWLVEELPRVGVTGSSGMSTSIGVPKPSPDGMVEVLRESPEDQR